MGPRSLFLFVTIVTLGNGILASPNRVKRQSRQAYGITNYEINEAVRRLEKMIRGLDNKLTRHEFREVQVADFSTKTLNALNSDHSMQQRNMKTVAKQLAALEEKMLALDALTKMVDERQRKIMNNLSEGLNRLLMARPDFNDLPPLPPAEVETEKEVKKILKKVNDLDQVMKRNLKGVNNEVKIVGESLRQHMEQLTERHTRIWNDFTSCQNDQVKALTEATSSISQTGNLFADQIEEAKNLISSSGSSSNCEELTNEVAERLDSLDRVYQDQEKQMSTLNTETHQSLQDQKEDLEKLMKMTELEEKVLENSFGKIFNDLNNFQSESDQSLSHLESTIKSISEESTKKIADKVQIIGDAIKLSSETVLNTLEDSASMSENLQNSMAENFVDLTKDIKSLKKVEQVMLSTADAVLDTKRSIEFGIQQVILELSEIVKTSGKNINSTLTDKINSISFDIVRNQTSALTNMTSKMEKEISQVWRQIGIMYQQVAQSVDILDDLQSSTSQHMNASLDKVGNMDGTVGAINNKVADVEDNLNFLLGRLSLVTSEFSQMKNGVGAELDKLREMAQEFSSGDLVEYKVNKKRSLNPEVFSEQNTN